LTTSSFCPWTLGRRPSFGPWISVVFLGKQREKTNAMVLFDKDTYDRLYKEVPKMKVVTISNLSERLKLNGSLARAAIKELVGKGLLKVTYQHRGMVVATSAESA